MEYSHQTYVISAGRANNLPFEKAALNHYIFCVKAGEGDQYRAAGCKHVYETGTLMQSRNWALDHAFDNGDICVQLSDDIKSVKYNPHVAGGKKETVRLQQAINVMVEKLNAVKGLRLLGVPPTSNAFFAKSPLSKNTFCIGDALFVKPSEPRFDINLTLKEDYDFTLQHIERYGIACRYQRFLWEFQHYSNAGGAVAYRDDAREQKNINYLLRKWPKQLRLNPKRKNEILLKA